MDEDLFTKGAEREMAGRETMKLKKLLALLGSGNVDYQDDAQRYIVIRPECEEWTWVRLNLNSGLLDFLGDLDVESIDAEDYDIVVWVKTVSFNCFRAVGGIDEGMKRDETACHSECDG